MLRNFSLKVTSDFSDLDVCDSLPSDILSRLVLELTVVVTGVFWGDGNFRSEETKR